MINTRTNSIHEMGLPRHTILAASRFSAIAFGMTVCLVTVAGCAVAHAQVGSSPAAEVVKVDLTPAAEQFPGDDAAILYWKQVWTVNADGSVSRRDHKFLKLFNGRPIRASADPRIDYNNDADKVVIHTAQTHLPDGTRMPVPEYSFNIAAPDDVAGWPQYSAWQQTVVSFSGIRDDVVLELDYEVISQPGQYPWVSADLRLEEEFPTITREVVVNVPEGATLRHRIDNLDEPNPPAKTTAGGQDSYRWVFSNLPGTHGESQSLPWRKRCGRLRFTSCSSARQWVSSMIAAVDKAAKQDASIKKFADQTVDAEPDSLRQAELIASKLHDTFNLIESPKTWRSLRCRPAAQVLQSNYGNHLEVAALCAAALQSLGIKTQVDVAVDAAAWDAEVPVDDAFAGMILTLNVDGETQRIRPTGKKILRSNTGDPLFVIQATNSGELLQSQIGGRGLNEASKFELTGKLQIDKDGGVSGDLQLDLTGAFFDPAKLDTSDAQKKLVGQMLGRIIPTCEVSAYSISVLSDERFEVTMSVGGKDVIREVDKHWVLKLGDGPALLGISDLPLGSSYRNTAVYLPGSVLEQVDLLVELPQEWKSEVVPASLLRIEGKWGHIGQDVKVESNRVWVTRNIAINAGFDQLIPQADFATVRSAINSLRSAGSVYMVFGPGPA